jgi:peptide/nickel transport system substrate-binding protein
VRAGAASPTIAAGTAAVGRPSTAAASPTPAAAQAIKRGGTLQFIGIAGEIINLDPHLNTQILLRDLGPGMAWSRVLKLKAGPDVPAGAAIPVGDLAESWEQPDDTNVIFHIRKGVKFHNKQPVNGRELKADDIVYSFTRQRDLKALASNLEPANSWTATDPYTLKMTLSRPDADFLLTMADGRNNVIAREAVELKGDLKDGPVVGTGAWMFDEWVPQNHVSLSRNPDYFVPGLPYADSIKILRLLDPSLQKSAFRTQQVYSFDASQSGGASGDFKQLKSDFPQLQLGSAQTYTGIALWQNAAMAPTSDIRVRQALSKAINRQEIIDYFAGLAWLGPGVVVPSPDWILPQEEMQKLLPQDVAGAKKLLSDAGLSNWSTNATVYSQPGYTATAELVQQHLKAVGVNFTLQPIDGPTLVTRVWTAMDANEGVHPTAATAAGANSFLFRAFHTGGGQNGSKMNDPQLDQLIEQQATLIKDTEMRKKLLQDIQRRLIELAAVAPLAMGVTQTLVWPFVKNFSFGSAAVNEYSRFDTMWLDK